MQKTCTVCGKAFATIRPNALTCSPACRRVVLNERCRRRYRQHLEYEHERSRRRHERELAARPPTLCVICGTPFKALNQNIIVCSPACRRQRLAEYKRRDALKHPDRIRAANRRTSLKRKQQQLTRRSAVNSDFIPAHQQALDIEHGRLHARLLDTEPIRAALAKIGRSGDYHPRTCSGCEKQFLVYGEQLATTPRPLYCSAVCEKERREKWREKQRLAIRAEIDRKEAAKAAEARQRQDQKLNAEVEALLAHAERGAGVRTGSKPQGGGQAFCLQCGAQIIGAGKNQKFCSRACQRLAAVDRPKRERTTHCESCGKPLIGAFHTRRYCSDDCLKAARRKPSAPARPVLSSANYFSVPVGSQKGRRSS
jgi:predicted nucleic acid-binding Zn ribbon protein